MDYYNIEFHLWLDSLRIEQPPREMLIEKSLLEEFNLSFPMEQLPHISKSKYFSEDGNRECLCSWLSSLSSTLSGKLFRLQNKCYGFTGDIARQNWRNRRNVYRLDAQDDAILQDEVMRPLFEYVKSKGEVGCAELKTIFPTPILLNILYLYWPGDFLPLLSEKWFDQIIWQFSLSQRETLVGKARECANFYAKIKDAHQIYPLGFVRLMDAYMGLSNWGDSGFGKFLEARGLSIDSVEKCKRTLRMWYSFKEDFKGKPSKYAKAVKEISFSRELEEYVQKHKRQSMLGFDTRFGPETALGLLREFCTKFDDCHRCSSRQIGIGAPTVKSFVDAKDAEELVHKLRNLGENHNSYMHYTNLTGLLHIVGGTPKHNIKAVFRLTRGDDEHMNDQLEWMRLGQEEIWKRTFLMCFQADENECAAMWGLYGKPDNEAVRIMFPHDVLMNWLELVKNGLERVYYYNGDNLQSKIIDLPKDSYEVALADVIYGGNVTGEKPIEKPQYVVGGKHIAIAKSVAGLEKTKAITGYIKSIDWSYEKETRIIVKIKDDLVADQLKHVKHIFISCEQLPFETLTYMFGPNVPEKLYEVYEQTLKDRIPGLKREYIQKSSYTGFLKFKQ